MAARCCSTRSPTCRSRPRARSCACCRSSASVRLGGDTRVEVDVRVIASTNRDLKARDGGRPLPRGPVLPPQRGAAGDAAPGRAADRHPGARPALHDRRRPSFRPAAAPDQPTTPWPCCRPRLAGRRAPAAQRDRVDADHGAGRARQPDRRGRPAARADQRATGRHGPDRQRRAGLDAAARGARAFRARLPAGPAAALRRQHLAHRELRRHGALGAAPQAEDPRPARATTERGGGPVDAAPPYAEPCRASPTSMAATPIGAPASRSRTGASSSPTASTRSSRCVRGRPVRPGAPSRPPRALARRACASRCRSAARPLKTVIRRAAAAQPAAPTRWSTCRSTAAWRRATTCSRRVRRPTLIVTVRRATLPKPTELRAGVGRCHAAGPALEALRHQVGEPAAQRPGRQQAAEAGCREVWLYDADGLVTEGAGSNAYIVDTRRQLGHAAAGPRHPGRCDARGGPGARARRRDRRRRTAVRRGGSARRARGVPHQHVVAGPARSPHRRPHRSPTACQARSPRACSRRIATILTEGGVTKLRPLIVVCRSGDMPLPRLAELVTAPIWCRAALVDARLDLRSMPLTEPLGASLRAKKRSRKTNMAAEKQQNLQDVFLNHVRKNKVPVTVFLINGVKLQGVISSFDNFCLLLRRDGHVQLVYKHAVSTVMPSRGRPALRAVGAKSSRAAAGLTGTPTPRATNDRRPTGGPGLGASRPIRAPVQALPRDARRAALAEAAGLARAIDLEVVRSRVRCRCARRVPATLLGSGKVEGDRPRAWRPSRPSWSSSTPRSTPVQQRNLENALEDQGHRPHRPDPRDLRRARPHPRGRAPGRAGGADLPALPAGALVDPSRAPARRLRLPGRPGREPARARPPPDHRAHRPDQGGAGGRAAHARPAPRGTQARALSRSWRWSATPTPASRPCSTG